jgi:hypothetical protein
MNGVWKLDKEALDIPQETIRRMQTQDKPPEPVSDDRQEAR